MGVTKRIIDDLADAVEDLFSFVVGSALILFILGSWFGAYYAGTNIFMYPVYALFVLLIFKVLKEISDMGRNKKEKKK